MPKSAKQNQHRFIPFRAPETPALNTIRIKLPWAGDPVNPGPRQLRIAGSNLRQARYNMYQCFLCFVSLPLQLQGENNHGHCPRPARPPGLAGRLTHPRRLPAAHFSAVASLRCPFSTISKRLRPAVDAQPQGEGDTVVARALPDRPGELVIESIQGDGGRLSLDPAKNCVGIAAAETLKMIGQPSCGVGLTLHKGLPLGSGMGSSAASAAAAAWAVNGLFGSPVSKVCSAAVAWLLFGDSFRSMMAGSVLLALSACVVLTGCWPLPVGVIIALFDGRYHAARLCVVC